MLRVGDTYLAGVENHEAGGPDFREYWVPAQDLDAVNTHLLGPIDLIAEYRGRSSDASSLIASASRAARTASKVTPATA